MLPSQLREPAVVPRDRGIRQLPLDLRSAVERVGEPLAKKGRAVLTQVVFFPNFWRKRSIRPAVSRNFCLPV